MCRDFLLIFLFAVTQEVNKEGCYHLSFPSLPPLIGTSNQATNSNSSPQHHSNSGDGEVIYFNSNSKEERNAEQNSPNSQKTISLLERQSSDRNNHQRYQALTALYDQTYSRLSKRPADFLEYSVSGGWSKAECFFRHLEQLPVALSIGAVEEEGEFCPLVYVNAAFEQLTQYSKSEALGKSCSFLQCEKTEKAQTMKIKKALEKSRAVKVGVTNSKKDGSMFLNLLALLPIHDRHGRYRYVLGKHEDVGSTTVTMRSVQHSEDVLYWVALVLRNI